MSLKYEPSSEPLHISNPRIRNQGLREGKRSQYELVLRCVLILTSVVPPELPMQVRFITHIGRAWYKRLDAPVRIEDAPLDVTLTDSPALRAHPRLIRPARTPDAGTRIRNSTPP